MWMPWSPRLQLDDASLLPSPLRAAVVLPEGPSQHGSVVVSAPVAIAAGPYQAFVPVLCDPLRVPRGITLYAFQHGCMVAAGAPDALRRGFLFVGVDELKGADVARAIACMYPSLQRGGSGHGEPPPSYEEPTPNEVYGAHYYSSPLATGGSIGSLLQHHYPRDASGELYSSPLFYSVTESEGGAAYYSVPGAAESTSTDGYDVQPGAFYSVSTDGTAYYTVPTVLGEGAENTYDRGAADSIPYDRGGVSTRIYSETSAGPSRGGAYSGVSSGVYSGTNDGPVVYDFGASSEATYAAASPLNDDEA